MNENHTPSVEKNVETRLLWKGRAKYIADTGSIIPSECLDKHPMYTNITFLFSIEFRKNVKTFHEAVGVCVLEVMPNGIDASCVLRTASVVVSEEDTEPILARINYLTNSARLNDVTLEPIEAGEIWLTQIQALVRESQT